MRRATILVVTLGMVVALAWVIANRDQQSPGGAETAGDDSAPFTSARLEAAAPNAQPGLHAIDKVPAPFAPVALSLAGDRIAVLGTTKGEPGENRLAFYTPSTGEWQEVARAPASAPLAGTTMAWVDDDLVLVGVNCDNRAGPEADEPQCKPGTVFAALYSPRTAKWQEIDPPPGAPSDLRDGAFGTLLGSTASTAVYLMSDQLWAFAPKDTTWTQLPSPPSPRASMCLAGTTIVATVPTFADGTAAATDPTTANASGVVLQTLALPGPSKWTSAAPLEHSTTFVDAYTGECDEHGVLVHTLSFDAAWTYDLVKGAWATAPVPAADVVTEPFAEGLKPPADMPDSRAFVNAAWTGEELVWWNPERSVTPPADEQTKSPPPTFHFPGNGMVFDPPTQDWRPVPPGPDTYGPADARVIAWDHGVGYTVVNVDGAANLATYVPDAGRVAGR